MRFKIQIITQGGVTLIERDCAYGQLPTILREIANSMDSETTVMSETREQIVAYMRTVGPTTPDAITRATGISRVNIQQHLKRMVKGSTARRLNYGRYEVV